jgi:predicted amidohydrolase
VTFKLRDRRCGVLICHDFRDPELYRELRRRGVEVVFNSLHNGRFSPEKAGRKGRIFRSLIPATLQAYAAVNHQWMSATNTTRRHSAWGVFTVQPDGLIARRLPRERSGVLTTDFDDPANYEDASRSWRDRALQGVLHSGKTIRHPRSADRRKLKDFRFWILDFRFCGRRIWGALRLWL